MFSEELSTKAMLFFVLYGITAVIPLIASAYLLLRRANAIAPSVTSPVRLRRWTASFFAVVTLAHVWWLLFYIISGDLHSVGFAVLSMVDYVLLFVTFVGMLLAMLQDRRRPMWPALAAMLPFVLLGTSYIVFSNSLLVKMASIYLLMLGLAFTGNMVFAIRQYERWLNNNYADLENKKVWLCLTVSLACMLMFILYVFADDMALIWLVHFVELVLVGLLLWRVETLPLLEFPVHSQTQQPTALPVTIDLAQIEQLLNELCVAPQLYLQHDLSRLDLAHAVGTNRSYLSQYFSRQGITYNTYINNLRINHFISRYQEVAQTGQTFTVQQLANESGFSSYRTFSRAFTERMGMSVTEWMQDTEK